MDILSTLGSTQIVSTTYLLLVLYYYCRWVIRFINGLGNHVLFELLLFLNAVIVLASPHRLRSRLSSHLLYMIVLLLYGL